MKHILITGANSYIGESFKNRVEKSYPNEFTIDTLDMKEENWKKKDFSGCDVILHVAGIVHKKEKPDMRTLYRIVNTELSVQTAKKARDEGVHQFIFMSSMSVYGKNVGQIRKMDKPNPNSYYGKSKLQAEKLIRRLETDDFRIGIIRSPMVYGEGCKGNYQLLKKFILKSPIFPDWKNKRSMIQIDVLCDFLIKLIREEKGGLYLPQDARYVCTAELVEELARENHKKIKFVKVFNWCIRLGLWMHIPIIEKVFGTLVYEK